MNGENRFVIEN